MAAAKLRATSAARGKSPLYILCAAVRAMTPGHGGTKRHAVLMLWLIAVSVAPRAIARRVIAYRFVVASRPRWFERVLRTVGHTRVGAQR
jgi:hypothetical protein